MELIKKTLDVKDATGWYLMQDEKRYWTEDFVDEESSEITTVERSEVVCAKGADLTPLTISLLVENGISTVKVSNIPLLGIQEKYLNLWETVMKTRSSKGDGKKTYYVTADGKKTYYVTADCPADAEAFISNYFEINIAASFELVKVNKLEYGKVIKMYETEREEYEADGTKKAHWYKCQIYSMIDDGGESRSAGATNLLVQATTFENAIEAIKVVMNKDEFDAIYNTIKLLQELNIVDVFIPDESVSYYSNTDLE